MSAEDTAAELYDYGIQNEESDIRAHVCVIAKRCYAFPTKLAVEIMEAHGVVHAGQTGVDGYTARGFAVPWKDIPLIRPIRLDDQWLEGFERSLPESEKGVRALAIVAKLLRYGRFPLWCNGDIVTETKPQIEGQDILARGRWRIQVKCDFTGGDKELGGTGNLFLQTAERNPFKII